MGRGKTTARRRNRDKKNKTTIEEPAIVENPYLASSTTPSSIIVTTTTSNMSLCRGASEQPASPSMSSWLSVLECQEEQLAKYPPTYYQHQHRRPRNWLPQPSGWWPCRMFRWIRDFTAAFLHLLVSEHWVDQVYTLVLLVGFLCGCWAAIEGVLHIVKGAAAQDADCSVFYVTIPGPIVTVSLVGQTPKAPNHGTYYYSVINGTTSWLDSIAPPTHSSGPTTWASAVNPVSPGITTTPPPSQAPTPGLPPLSGSPSATRTFAFLHKSLRQR